MKQCLLARLDIPDDAHGQTNHVHGVVVEQLLGGLRAEAGIDAEGRKRRRRERRRRRRSSRRRRRARTSVSTRRDKGDSTNRCRSRKRKVEAE